MIKETESKGFQQFSPLLADFSLVDVTLACKTLHSSETSGKVQLSPVRATHLRTRHCATRSLSPTAARRPHLPVELPFQPSTVRLSLFRSLVRMSRDSPASVLV